MEKYFGTSFEALLAIFISGAGIYFAVILFTRLLGKRSFSKMSSFDFAMTIAMGSIIGSTLLLPSVSLVQGITGLGAIYLFQYIVAFLRRYEFFHTTIDNTPLLLMDGENILKENLLKAKVTEKDLRSKLRASNIFHLSQVKAVVFETTGDISVLHSREKDQQPQEWILKDVNRN